MAFTLTPQKWAERAKQAAQIMRDAKPLAYQGKRSSDPITTTRGTSVEYLASRLRRDHPAIADRVEAGEFHSIRSAALAAGIVKHRQPAI